MAMASRNGWPVYRLRRKWRGVKGMAFLVFSRAGLRVWPSSLFFSLSFFFLLFGCKHREMALVCMYEVDGSRFYRLQEVAWIKAKRPLLELDH